MTRICIVPIIAIVIIISRRIMSSTSVATGRYAWPLTTCVYFFLVWLPESLRNRDEERHLQCVSCAKVSRKGQSGHTSGCYAPPRSANACRKINVTLAVRGKPHFSRRKTQKRNVAIFFKEMNSFFSRKFQRYDFAFCPIKNNCCEACVV